MSMITDRIEDTKFITIMTKFENQNNHLFLVFMKNNSLLDVFARQQCMHCPITKSINCPITSMMHTPSN